MANLLDSHVAEFTQLTKRLDEAEEALSKALVGADPNLILEPYEKSCEVWSDFIIYIERRCAGMESDSEIKAALGVRKHIAEDALTALELISANFETRRVLNSRFGFPLYTPSDRSLSSTQRVCNTPKWFGLSGASVDAHKRHVRALKKQYQSAGLPIDGFDSVSPTYFPLEGSLFGVKFGPLPISRTLVVIITAVAAVVALLFFVARLMKQT